MDQERKRVAKRRARDQRMERLRAEVAIVKSIFDPATQMHELILMANDPSLWADAEGNVL